METILLIAMMGAAVYFLMIRPQQKRTKEQQKLMSELAPGSRVMTISGIVGTIKYLGDKQAILEVSPGVEMTIDKRALSTQPVVDEFEYADEDAEPTTAELEADEAEFEVADATDIEVADVDPVESAETDSTDSQDSTWDNPGSEKN